MSQEPAWIHIVTVRHIHRQQISTFGGMFGIRDQGMLESALIRPINLWLYEEPSLFRLAAAYAFGIAMNHPFVDGNKCVAFVVSVIFIELNGYKFAAPEVDAATTFTSLAAGELGEVQLSGWFEAWSTNTLES